MDNDIIEFTNYLKQNKISLKLIERFKIYHSVLNEKSQRLNLISKNSLEKIWSAHFLDSILICDKINFSNKTVLDFGSGAGFPGIPIKILYPTMKIYLIESVRKKVLFLRYLLEKLDLQESNVINNRIENLDISFDDVFDFVLVRAVRMKYVYYKKCFDLLKRNGEIIIYQSENFHNQVEDFRKKYPNKNVRIISNLHPIKGIRKYIIIKND
ncbi:MAG: 16S rRNA (guanine(527)-N(7))-methyltransferase RsmG [Candidatus Cloacimonetes bacterium]|nr:16S rRNA (guanine(527)-N(7))-methyltransferase RsmG [Candidatus Cloacimonadota bacterium]